MVTQRTLRPFRTYLTVNDGDAAYDTEAEVAALVEAATGNTGFATIWEKTVPAQQAYRWGFSTPDLQQNQGFIMFFAIDAGTGYEEGIIRLNQLNANRTIKHVVAELATQNLHAHAAAPTAITATENDKNSLVPLPEQTRFPAVAEDSLLQIEWKPTAVTTTVDVVRFSIPCTLYQ